MPTLTPRHPTAYIEASLHWAWNQISLTQAPQQCLRTRQPPSLPPPGCSQALLFASVDVSMSRCTIRSPYCWLDSAARRANPSHGQGALSHAGCTSIPRGSRNAKAGLTSITTNAKHPLCRRQRWMCSALEIPQTPCVSVVGESGFPNLATNGRER
jgi:hypothetical protein